MLRFSLSRSRLFILFCLSTSLGGWATPTYAQSTGICPAQLGAAIERLTTAPDVNRADWGILVQAQNSSAQSNPQTLYAQNADRYFVPASNTKLLTTAAVLQEFGANFRIRTSVYQLQSQPDQVVLQVVGRGDPSFSEQDLQQLVQQIRDRGITRINLLIGDDSYFQGDPVNPTWEWGDVQAGYGALVNSLILNENAIGFSLVPQTLGQPLQVRWDDPAQADQWQVNNRSQTVATNAPEFVTVGRDLTQPVLEVAGQLRVGSAAEPVSVSIPRPAQFFMQQLLQRLAAANIQVDQSLITLTPLNEQGTEIAAIDSAPLSELLVETNQQSNNLYAEALLRSLGVHQSPQAVSALESGALESGIKAVEQNLTQLGVDQTGYTLADGSGLSRHNLVSPGAIVQTLQAMLNATNALPYRNSLSVAGESGTLRNRFQGTEVAGRLQGKTGSLSDTVALSGYLEPPEYPPLVLSILVNQINPSSEQVQTTIDQIVELLVKLQPC
ncbi:MAG TPA: D-alanyl-D-alanine carboxypeptidase/D-alanyl-D-alanine-endopeptidase [Allocoleopsis sp.]